jgi:hypothetical protein
VHLEAAAAAVDLGVVRLDIAPVLAEVVTHEREVPVGPVGGVGLVGDTQLLLLEVLTLALSRALPMAGSRMPTSSAMIETTTSSSMMVKPLLTCLFMADHVLSVAHCASRRARPRRAAEKMSLQPPALPVTASPGPADPTDDRAGPQT